MQPAGRIADDHVHAARAAGGDRVEHDGGRVCPFRLAYHLDAGAVRPNLELVDSRRAERVSRAEQHLLALRFKAGRQLADGRRLAHTVDANDEHDRRLC